MQKSVCVGFLPEIWSNPEGPGCSVRNKWKARRLPHHPTAKSHCTGPGSSTPLQD
ncbi:hypothetical protein LEMLEM_LOCUS12568, partial [Lemmus lemmus]